MSEQNRRHHDPMRQEQWEFALFGLALVMVGAVVWAFDIHGAAVRLFWRVMG